MSPSDARPPGWSGAERPRRPARPPASPPHPTPQPPARASSPTPPRAPVIPPGSRSGRAAPSPTRSAPRPSTPWSGPSPRARRTARDALAGEPLAQDAVADSGEAIAERTRQRAYEAGRPVRRPEATPAEGETPARREAAASGSETESLARPTAIMAAGTIISRLTGFGRNAAMIAAVGVTTMSGNAFGLANTMPNFLNTVIAGGLLNALLVPQIVRAYQRKTGQSYVNRLLTIGILLIGGITLVATAGAGAFTWIYGGSRMPTAQYNLAVAFAFWCIPQMFFYGMYSMISQVLNARRVFGPEMWAPIVNNIVSIAGFVAFIVIFGTEGNSLDPASVAWWTPTSIAFLAGTATLGIAAQAAVLWIPLRRTGFRFALRSRDDPGSLRSAGQMAFWTLLALLLDQGATLIAQRAVAAAPQAALEAGVSSGAVASTVAWQNGLMIYILPHSVLTISIATAMFTSMSDSAGLGNRLGVRRHLNTAMRTTGVLMVFCTALLCVLALPITRLLMPTSRAADVPVVGNIVVAMAIGLVPLGISILFRRVHYAFEDARTMFFSRIPINIVYAAGILAAEQFLDPQWWVVGVAIAQTVSYFAAVVFMAGGVRRFLGNRFGREALGVLARATLAVLVVSELGWLVLHQFPSQGADSLLWAAVACVTVGLVMLVGYLVLLRILRIPDFAQFLGPFVRRLTGRRGGSTAK